VRLDGRYWVLDYKTNRLPSPDDYREPGLSRAMREHGYDLQALIYAVALHRELRARLGAAYVPSRDFGGAIYLFVRGAAAGDGVHRTHYDADLLDALDRAFSQPQAQR
jgi:exodeoxyribonuclease V beta subunit